MIHAAALGFHAPSMGVPETEQHVARAHASSRGLARITCWCSRWAVGACHSQARGGTVVLGLPAPVAVGMCPAQLLPGLLGGDGGSCGA